VPAIAALCIASHGKNLLGRTGREWRLRQASSVVWRWAFRHTLPRCRVPYPKFTVSSPCPVERALLSISSKIGLFAFKHPTDYRLQIYSIDTHKKYKKLSCRGETARRFVSLNILLSHSRSFEMTLLSRACVSHYYYFIETMSVCCISDIFSDKEWCDLETGVRGFSRSLKMAPIDRSYDFLLAGHCKYSCMLYHFQIIWRWISLTLKRSLKVIESDTIRKLWCGFLLAIHSNRL